MELRGKVDGEDQSLMVKMKQTQTSKAPHPHPLDSKETVTNQMF